jgi:CubicO group peptidase (beta-lactamase class C family)
MAEMTVHDLLRHTSGLTYGFFNSHGVQRLYTDAGIGAPDAGSALQCERMARLPLLSQPGTAWTYGHSTDVLGRLIEVISGQGLGQFLQHRIFAPLGMKDTGFQVPHDQRQRIAEPHAVDPQGGGAIELLNVRAAHVFESGGGGLVSTAGDYALFLQCLLNGGSLGGVRLLGHKTVQWMTSDHLGDRPVLGDVLPAGHGFGLGFAVRRDHGLAPLPGSAGLYYWGGIAGTTFFVDPAEQLFAILMIQAPMQRLRYRALFRQLVYAALAD